VKKLISIGLPLSLLVLPVIARGEGKAIVVIKGEEAPFAGLLVDKEGVVDMLKIQAAFDDCAEKNSQLIEWMSNNAKEVDSEKKAKFKQGMAVGIVGTSLLAIVISLVAGGK
jgi:hypothetical protein